MKHIKKVSLKNGLEDFIDFPHNLYRNDPMYVPELFIAQRDLLTTHPFHEHSSLQCFLLYEDDQIIGRIAAILNTNHNTYNGSRDGFFGFFDVINDSQSALMLIIAAEEWLKQRGVNNLIGPANFSTNEACGLLISGFDSPPVVMMTYNAPYYEELLELAGLTKKVDLLAWRWEGDDYNSRVLSLMEKLELRLANSQVTIRKVNIRKFKEESKKLREVYNGAWDKNTGFVPLTDKEFDYQAKDLKLILDPDFCYVAEKHGEIIGLGIAIPDVNQIQKKIPKGRLLPWGIFKLLFGLKKVTGIRILLLGVLEEHRKLGIEACLYGNIIKSYRRKGLKYAEASWTLEHNHLVNNAIIAIGGKAYKKYRLYEKPI